MSEEETRRVVEMVSDATISPEEGARLLDSLDPHRPDQADEEGGGEPDDPANWPLSDFGISSIVRNSLKGAAAGSLVGLGVRGPRAPRLRRPPRPARPPRPPRPPMPPRARRVTVRGSAKGHRFDQLIALSSLGISPQEFRALKQVVPRADDDEIIGALSVGLTATYVEDMAEVLGEDFDLGEAIGAYTMGVDASYVEEVRDLFESHDSKVLLEEMMGFASLGIKPSYVEEMHDAFAEWEDPLTPDDIMGLASLGVDPTYVEQVYEAADEPVGPDDIMGFASMGVAPEEIRDYFED